MMSVSGSPPYSWVSGTNLAKSLLLSQQLCEAMQALTNRANLVFMSISNWSAYDYYGDVLQNLGQTPDDVDLVAYAAWRHVNHILDLRNALERVLPLYFDDDGHAYTLPSLLQEAVSRNSYNRAEEELLSLGYFDGEDAEEILKCVDLLVGNWYVVRGYVNDTLVVSYGVSNDIHGIAATPGTVTSVHELWEDSHDHSTQGKVTNIVGNLTGPDEIKCVFDNSGTNSSVMTDSNDNDKLMKTGDYHYTFDLEARAGAPVVLTYTHNYTTSPSKDEAWTAMRFHNINSNFCWESRIRFDNIGHRVEMHIGWNPTLVWPRGSSVDWWGSLPEPDEIDGSYEVEVKWELSYMGV